MALQHACPGHAPACRSQTPLHAPPSPQDDAVWEFDSWGVDLPAALRLLAELTGGSRITPGVNCGGAFCSPARPQLPAGECGRQRDAAAGGGCLWMHRATAMTLLPPHTRTPCRPADCCHHVPDGGSAAASRWAGPPCRRLCLCASTQPCSRCQCCRSACLPCRAGPCTMPCRSLACILFCLPCRPPQAPSSWMNPSPAAAPTGPSAAAARGSATSR